MATQDNTGVLRTFYEALNQHNIEGAVACFQNDGEFKTIAFDNSVRGSTELREMIQGWITAFPDLKLDVTEINGTGDWAAAELVVRGTQKGPFATPMGTIPATNQRVQTPTCDVVKFKNGKISSIHCYLETGTLMRQLKVKSENLAA